ncbi:MAG: insulinase family protein [Candidatus Omnitrophica bacterium]|nr:insulinase family protein [Candidatus Omnitrophota bacterium]
MGAHYSYHEPAFARDEKKEILNNGLTVIIKEEHAHPIVCIMLTVDAGLSSEGAYGGTGISHFIEHMIFKGTPKRKPGQIEEEVKSYGGVTNASTGLDNTTYYITVPSEYTLEALDLMNDMIFHPAFDNDEIEKERDVILKEIRLNRDDPARRVMRQLWQTAYLEHPYKLPVIGHKNLFMELKRSDLVKYHSTHYTPNNAILTVIGDIDKDKILSEIKSTFAKYARKRSPAIAVSLEPQQNSSRELTGYTQINLGYLAMGYHTVELTNNDLYALDILGIILGDWDNSRLKKRLIKERELLYTVSSFNYTPKYPGLFIIYGVGDPAKLEDSKKKILEEIKKITKEGVEKAELEAAKNMVIASYIDSLETANGLAKSLSQSEFLAGDPAFFEKYVDNTKKVTKESIKRVARKYLNENNLSVSYLFPDYGVSESDAAEKETKSTSLPQRVVLPNGISLILKEDHRIPKVALFAAFLGGVRVETRDNNGISNLTSAMLLKGTKKRKEDRIKSALESMGGYISHFSGKNSFGLSIGFLAEDAERALGVLEDVTENATFPELEIKKQKEKIYAAIKRQDDDIYSMGFLKLRKAIFEDYAYGLRAIGERDSVKNITRRDIQDFYEKFCVSNNMVISVVGDFEVKKMRESIENRFSDMRNTPLKIKAEKPIPLSGLKEITYKMPREQSLVVIGFRGTTLASREKYCLQVLGSVLSGENGRLYQSIRNTLGLSYTQGAFSAPGIDTGYVASYVATDRKNLKKATEVLLKELGKIRRGEISEEEVELAKKSLIGRHKISLQTYNALAYTMVLGELYGTGFDDYANFPEYISGITRNDIVKAAEKYIDLKNFATVSVIGKEDE